MGTSLHALGSNGGGQLGIGHLEDVSTPTRCLFVDDYPRSPLKAIAAGGNHTILLLENGLAYATGVNHDGRCGLLVQQDPLTRFQKVLFRGADGSQIDHFKFVAATWDASIFVAQDDRIYTCGSGAKGELGHDTKNTRLEMPRCIPDFPPPQTHVQAVASCMAHVVVVLSNGEAYGWGNGRKGQLGEPRANVSVPRKITVSETHNEWTSVACGRDYTCLEPRAGTLLLEIIGLDKSNTFRSLREVAIGPKSVSASWGSLYVLDHSGKLLSAGRNDHGQLEPTGPQKLRQVEAGSEHVLAQTTDGRVLAWGWGEHGNCGLPVDGHGDVRDTWNDLGEGKVVGAGCATSFVELDSGD